MREHVFAAGLWVNERRGGAYVGELASFAHTLARSGKLFVVCGTLFWYVCLFVFGAQRLIYFPQISASVGESSGDLRSFSVLICGRASLSHNEETLEWQQEKMAAHAKNTHTDTNANTHAHTQEQSFWQVSVFSALVFWPVFCQPFFSATDCY